jgi:hypothetical protein
VRLGEQRPRPVFQQERVDAAGDGLPVVKPPVGHEDLDVGVELGQLEAQDAPYLRPEFLLAPVPRFQDGLQPTAEVDLPLGGQGGAKQSE